MADTKETPAPTTLTDELTSPINLLLIAFIVYLLIKIIKSKFESNEPAAPPPPPLPKIRKDLTVEELKKYDGSDKEGRIFLAVNGVIFDVTKGNRFYGPGGPYAAFAGKDATRGLATGQVEASEKPYDDCSDLTPDEKATAKEWEDQFRERYDIVGKLLKPGETAQKYSDDESEKTEDKKQQ